MSKIDLKKQHKRGSEKEKAGRRERNTLKAKAERQKETRTQTKDY